MAALGIVQSAKAQPGSTGTSIPFTLGADPTPGNLLVAFLHANQFGATRVVDTTGWTVVDTTTNSACQVVVAWRVAQAGDTLSSFSFPVSGTAEWHSGVMYELVGADPATPINQHGTDIDNLASGSNVEPTATVTPSVLGTLALAAITTDTGSTNVTSITAVSAGWSLDQSAVPQFVSTFGAHRTALTSDTSTGISNTFTESQNTAGAAVMAIVLINPAPPTKQFVPQRMPLGV